MDAVGAGQRSVSVFVVVGGLLDDAQAAIVSKDHEDCDVGSAAEAQERWISAGMGSSSGPFAEVVFVCNPFGGDAFDWLRNNGASIISPFALQHLSTMQPGQVLYSASMGGVRAFVDDSCPNKDRVANLMRWLGAAIVPSPADGSMDGDLAPLTHLVAATVSPDVREAKARYPHIKCYKPAWVLDCWEKSANNAMQGFQIQNQLFELRPLQGLVLAIHPSVANSALMSQATSKGAVVLEQIQPGQTTHLVTNMVGDDMFVQAQQLGIPCVLSKWLLDCLKAKNWLDVTPFLAHAVDNDEVEETPCNPSLRREAGRGSVKRGADTEQGRPKRRRTGSPALMAGCQGALEASPTPSGVSSALSSNYGSPTITMRPSSPMSTMVTPGLNKGFIAGTPGLGDLTQTPRTPFSQLSRLFSRIDEEDGSEGPSPSSAPPILVMDNDYMAGVTSAHNDSTASRAPTLGNTSASTPTGQHNGSNLSSSTAGGHCTPTTASAPVQHFAGGSSAILSPTAANSMQGRRRAQTMGFKSPLGKAQSSPLLNGTTSSQAKVRRAASVSTPGRLVGTPAVAPAPQPLSDRLADAGKASKRHMRIAELFDKEQSFLNVLTAIDEVYRTPLSQEYKALLPTVVLGEIFSNIDRISEISSRIVAGLAQVLGDWDEERSSVAAIFTDEMLNKNILPQYKRYITGIGKAKETLEGLMKSSHKLAYFVQLQQNNPRTKRQTLSGLLMHPVQHVARYALLFKDIKKATPPDHSDYANLDHLVSAFDKVMTQVDSARGDQQRYEKMFSLMSTVEDFPPTICHPERAFLRQHTLQLYTEGQFRKGVIMVFNDSLLVATKPHQIRKKLQEKFAKSAGKHYKFFAFCKFEDCVVLDHIKRGQASAGGAAPEQRFFQLVIFQKSREPDCTIHFQTEGEDEKFALLKDLRDEHLACCGKLPDQMQQDETDYQARMERKARAPQPAPEPRASMPGLGSVNASPAAHAGFPGQAPAKPQLPPELPPQMSAAASAATAVPPPVDQDGFRRPMSRKQSSRTSSTSITSRITRAMSRSISRSAMPASANDSMNAGDPDSSVFEGMNASYLSNTSQISAFGDEKENGWADVSQDSIRSKGRSRKATWAKGVFDKLKSAPKQFARRGSLRGRASTNANTAPGSDGPTTTRICRRVRSIHESKRAEFHVLPGTAEGTMDCSPAVLPRSSSRLSEKPSSLRYLRSRRGNSSSSN